MAKSTYLASALLDHHLGGPSYTRPATVYVALFTTGTTEPAGGSYARVAVTNNATNFPAAVAGAKSNGTEIAFPTATAGWGTVTRYGLYDDPTAGNLLRSASLNTPRAVITGDTPRFAAGALDFTEA